MGWEECERGRIEIFFEYWRKKRGKKQCNARNTVTRHPPACVCGKEEGDDNWGRHKRRRRMRDEKGGKTSFDGKKKRMRIGETAVLPLQLE